MARRLFPIDLPALQWSTFTAEGFKSPVAGVIFRTGQSTCGVPLGGIGTGCIDLDTDGSLGRCSIFNTFVPHRTLGLPFLALSVGSKAWALTTQNILGIGRTKQIHYWGHYPIADLEFEIDSPIEVGLRAWSPFVPGNAVASNTPAACFEMHLRNVSDATVNGTILFTFPGPTDAEAGARLYQHGPVHGAVNGVSVTTATGNGYLLGVAGTRRPRVGRFISLDSVDWADVNRELPSAENDAPGACLAIDFCVGPGEHEIVPLVLSWYSPRWAGSAAHHFWHAYSQRFRSAIEVAENIVANRGTLMAQILSWQAEIYKNRDLPIWLQDQLVNILHTIPEDSFWACESIPPETWYKPTGLFGLTESPRTTPHICNPSDWVGGLPIVFFFPELAAALLRAYVHFQLSTGEIPVGIGEGSDLVKPEYRVIPIMNSLIHVQLIDRLWQRDLSAAVLREFYPSVRQAVDYTKGLDRDGDGLPDLDPDPIPNHYYGKWAWYGASIHVGGLWLATLCMAERMAREMGDSGFMRDCRVWYERGRQTLEEKLWEGRYYAVFNDPVKGKRSDTIFANQLVGQLCADLHGLNDILDSGRVETVLNTIKDTCMPATPYGVVNAIRPNGAFDTCGSPYSDGIFTGECICVAMTMLYAGHSDTGSEIARRAMHNVVLRQGAAWDIPNIVNSSSGEIIHGHDFYQMMILWGLPLALSKQSINQVCKADGLVGRVLFAAEHPTG